jgi:hypothetical protein
MGNQNKGSKNSPRPIDASNAGTGVREALDYGPAAPPKET